MQLSKEKYYSDDELIDTKELAKFLGISIAGVYRMVESRQIPFLKVRKLLRFRRADVVKAFLKKPEVESEVSILNADPIVAIASAFIERNDN